MANTTWQDNVDKAVRQQVLEEIELHIKAFEKKQHELQAKGERTIYLEGNIDGMKLIADDLRRVIER